MTTLLLTLIYCSMTVKYEVMHCFLCQFAMWSCKSRYRRLKVKQSRLFNFFFKLTGLRDISQSSDQWCIVLIFRLGLLKWKNQQLEMKEMFLYSSLFSCFLICDCYFFLIITSNKYPNTATPVRSSAAWDRLEYSSLMWTICICWQHEIEPLLIWTSKTCITVALKCHIYYLHRILFSIDGVFGPGASILAPVEVHLKCLVCSRELPLADLYTCG